MLRYYLYVLSLVPWGFALGVTTPERRVFCYLMIGNLLALVILVDASGKVRRRWLRKRVGPHLEPLWQRYGKHRPLSHFSNWQEGLSWLGRRCLDGLIVWFAFLPGAVYVPVGIGLAPGLYLLGGLLLGAWLWAQWKRGLPKLLQLDPVMVGLLPLHLCGVALWLHYAGSSASACAKISKTPHVQALVSRQDLETAEAIEETFPYDVRSDGNLLFYSLKQRRSGFIPLLAAPEPPNDGLGVLDRRTGFRRELLLPIESYRGGVYPQRLTVNPSRGEVYAVALDLYGKHHLLVARYSQDLSIWEVAGRIDLAYEPIRTYLTDANTLLVLGYEGRASRYELRNGEELAHYLWGDRGRPGVLDTLVPDATGEGYYASVVSSKFHRLRASDFEVMQSVEIGVPTIGLDYDQERNLVYAAGTFTREILVLDGDTLEVLRRRFTGTTVREILYDRERDCIYALGYIGGELDIYDAATLRHQQRVRLGRVARGLHLQRKTGRLFAATSCGIFEVFVDGMLEEGR